MKRWEYMRIYCNARWREDAQNKHYPRVYCVNVDQLEEDADLIAYLNELCQDGQEREV